MSRISALSISFVSLCLIMFAFFAVHDTRFNAQLAGDPTATATVEGNAFSITPNVQTIATISCSDQGYFFGLFGGSPNFSITAGDAQIVLYPLDGKEFLRMFKGEEAFVPENILVSSAILNAYPDAGSPLTTIPGNGEYLILSDTPLAFSCSEGLRAEANHGAAPTGRDTYKSCINSGQCSEGYYCTIEDGECNSYCPTGTACTQTCAGRCAPDNREKAGGEMIRDDFPVRYNNGDTGSQGDDGGGRLPTNYSEIPAVCPNELCLEPPEGCYYGMRNGCMDCSYLICDESGGGRLPDESSEPVMCLQRACLVPHAGCKAKIVNGCPDCNQIICDGVMQ